MAEGKCKEYCELIGKEMQNFLAETLQQFPQLAPFIEA